MRPRIAIDFSSFDGLNVGHGLYRYGVDLAHGLAITRPRGEFHLIGSQQSPPAELAGLFSETGNRWVYHHLPRRPPTRGAFFLDQLVATKLVTRISPDLLHGLDYFLPFAAPCRLVVTIYDLMAEVLTPREHYRRPFYLNCLRGLIRWRISRLIAISNTTAQDLRSRWGVPANRLSTVQMGTRLPPLLPGTPRTTIPELPTLLVRYSLARQKNMPAMLHAFARLRSEFPELRLILFGSGGVTPEQDAEITRLLARLGIAEAVERTGLLTDEELDALYKKATLFVLPSTYEGFGLTLLEAMARGVCVVAHNTGAMAEVVGAAGRLVDARTSESLAAGLAEILRKPERIRELSNAGCKRAHEFSVERMAERTYDVYRRCLS